MAWNIAGVDRRTRDAAVEAARRAGMRLDDWLDEVITDHAGLDLRKGLEHDRAEDDRLDAAAGRLERIARRNERAQAQSAARSSDSFSSAIEHFEVRLARAEAQAARAFESVAEILERDDATRDGDRRALIDAVRRLETIRTSLTDVAQNGERRGDGLSSAAIDPKAPFDLKAAVSQIAMRRHELEERAGRGETRPLNAGRGTDAPPAEEDTEAEASLSQSPLDDVRALGLQLDDMRRERADPSASVALGAMRAEMEAMGRSLADLAPRNAVVALEGAIRDLVQRVDLLRQGGHGESMLAPLEAMAAEFRAALRAHDPQPAVAGLEREIRAIGGKIDSLVAAAIEPETFETIRRQTEEVRNLLASAALRTPPLEQLERQIGELADRVERLGASPAPQFESAEMAALLAEACRQIEHSTPPAALVSIERRLEEIAARLDQEIARPNAPAAIDSGPLEDLARRIDSVRQSLEKPATVDTGPIERLLHDFDARLAATGRTDGDAQALQSIFAEIGGKLDRLADPELGVRQDAAVAPPVDLNPIETLLRSLEAKLEASAAAPVDREVVEQVADEVVRRLQNVSARQVDLETVAQQIDTIYDRIDTLAATSNRADDVPPAVQQLLEKLSEADRVSGSLAAENSAAINAALGAHLAELKSEQVGADQRTQARLTDLQGILEMLGARLASIESELAADDVDEVLRPPARSANPVPPISSIAHGADAGPEAAPPTLEPSEGGERGRTRLAAGRRRRGLPHRARCGRAAARPRSP